MNKPTVRGLRINTKKAEATQVCEMFEKEFNSKLKPISYAKDGFIFDSELKIGNHPSHLSGLYYFQEPSSMAPVIASRIQEEERVLKILDLCASPGGKTGQIACRVNDESIIFSNEIISSRASVLFSNVERQGFKNIIITNEEPEGILKFEGYFDYVFVDAPCSGEGMFRRVPETITEWSQDKVLMCKKRQQEILEIAEKLLVQGGKLVYSTCTFSEEEDEEIVEWLVNNFDYELQDVPEEIKQVSCASTAKVKNAEFARKFYQFSNDGEGQFVAVLKKKQESKNNNLYSKKHGKCITQIGQSENKLVQEFTNSDLLENFSWRDLYRVGDNIFLAPKSFDGDIRTALEDIKFVLVGVKIGSIEKNRFEPNHNLFMTHQELFKIKIELDNNELGKYLHGEEIFRQEIKEKGYGIVTRNGFAIGGVKISNGRLKNLYPRGLRI